MKIHKIYIAFFLLAIAAPGIFSAGRILTNQPQSVGYSKFEVGKDFCSIVTILGSTLKVKTEQFFNDQFSLRKASLEIFNRIKSDLLNVDPWPDKVVKGSDGWYFLGDSYNKVVRKSKSLDHLSDDLLFEISRELIERSDRFRNTGIKFYVIVAPNKHSIYGDFLEIRNGLGPTDIQRLLAILPEDFNIITVEDIISDNAIRLFHKTNAHWNDYGAFLFYEAFMRSITKQNFTINVTDLSSYEFYDSITYQEDLTRILDQKEKETRIMLRYIDSHPLPKKLFIPEYYKQDSSEYELRFKTGGDLPKLVMFGDSFSPNLAKFLKLSFGESLIIRTTHLDQEIIRSEKPDIVIQQIVERNLERLID